MPLTIPYFLNDFTPPKIFVQAIQPPTSVADAVALFAFLLIVVGSKSHGKLWDRPDPNYHVYFSRPQEADGSIARKQASRNIAERLEEAGNQVVIFWGSQSGTSERFAEQLARDCSLCFGLSVLVADLSDYDAHTISLLQNNKLAIFLLSTYGEGDPSDNATGFWDWIRHLKDEGTKLPELRYFAFGLGNSNYKYYNKVVDVVADALDDAGATCVLPTGRADDATGTTEEDFLAWKDNVFTMFQERMGLEKKEVAYNPTVKIDFKPPTDNSDAVVHYGKPSATQSATCSSVSPLSIKNSYELFTAGSRNCIHMDLDLSDHPEVVYKTGDHIGVWPCNPDEEANLLLKALGLDSQRDDILHINEQSKIPSPTTLQALFRNYLEIRGLLSRKAILDLALFAPTPSVKARVQELGTKEQYAKLVSNTHITLARFLRLTSPDTPWSTLPLAFLVETIPALQPRYYSISSSSVISPRQISITAVVSNKNLENATSDIIHGLTSNYLLSASNLPVGVSQSSSTPQPIYNLTGPENILNNGKLFAHVRKSKFKLPIMSTTPLVMIAAGTGLAPFRAFIVERVKLAAVGKTVGKMVLFFGCRNPNEDFIYREELLKAQEQLGADKFEIVTAFSRVQGQEKLYVQDRVHEKSEDVLQMLDNGANLYICGKASMAREVDRKIEDARAKQTAGEEVKGWVEGMKRRGKWKTDVWG